MSLLSECRSLQEFITRTQVDAVIWKAGKLLAGVDNPITLNDRVAEIAGTIAKIPSDQQVAKDFYIQKISKDFNLNKRTLEKYVLDQTAIERKKSDLKSVKKNRIAKLDGDPKIYPFFTEKIADTKKDGRVFKGLEIDKLKYVQLLKSFGFTRYPLGSDFIFVQIIDNVIKQVDIKEIIDYFENFIKKEYDFERADCEFADVEKMVKELYDSIKELSNETLLSRVVTEDPIIFNQDTAEECFLYYKNGFVRVTKESYELMPYSKMPGSVWQKQMLEREFKKQPVEFIENEAATAETPPVELYDLAATFSRDFPLGIFADFVWRISGERNQRFYSLCSIIGYLVHDYYAYTLKMPLLTDSIVSEKNEGRSGKSLTLQMLGHVRSYAEVNGKTFDQASEKKYAVADQSTQIMHINDIIHFGRYKFILETMYPDITEGVSIKHMYQEAFVKKVKIAGTTNKSMMVEGGSARDRVIEFEVSSFFSEHRKPKDFYNSWLGGDDWDEKQWMLYDNFICFCSQIFLEHGMSPPETINLEARKLLDGTCREFLEFMGDIADEIRTTGQPWIGYGDNGGPAFERAESIRDFEFDKKKLFDRFLILYPDFKNNHFSQKRFTGWLQRYSLLALGVKDPMERRSNGVFYIRFKSESETPRQS